MSRLLGIDVGTVRHGVAVSDASGLIATPLATVPAGPGAVAALRSLAESESVARVVVGLPKALSGRDTDSTRMARALAEELAAAGLDVALWDERYSSAQAERALLTAGRKRAQRRAERDRIAAAIILQGWLDAHRPSSAG